jgi:hypothetical protein
MSCGHRKFGAIVPCPKCGVASCGDMNVDIAFSDHHLSVAAIEALGDVIRAITPHAPDPAERFWTFMQYVSTNHPSILRIDLEPAAAERVNAILAAADPPKVTLDRSPRAGDDDV